MKVLNVQLTELVTRNALRPAILLKETPVQVFFCEFVKPLGKPILQSTSRRLLQINVSIMQKLINHMESKSIDQFLYNGDIGR